MRTTESKASRFDDLTLYFRQIGDEPLLTQQEEQQLSLAIKAGDVSARDRMIRANLRLVVTIAKHFQGYELTLPDLIGEGTLGLIRATTDFDPSVGTRFSAYASYWIRQTIRLALVNTAARIRLPAHMVAWMYKWRKEARRLRRELGGEPTFEQIADTLELSAKRRLLVAQALQTQVAIYNTAANDFGELVGLTRVDDPSAPLERELELQVLRRRMEQLPSRYQRVIRLRFGLDGDEPQTLKQVAKQLRISLEHARRMEIAALANLENPATSLRLPSPRKHGKRAPSGVAFRPSGPTPIS